MEHVEAFLKSLGLGQYTPAFEGNGYDSLDILFVMDDDDFERFGPFIGMLPGHLYRLKLAVNKMKQSGTSVETELFRVPVIQLPEDTTVTDGETENDGPAAAAAAAAAVAATSCVTPSLPTK